MQSAVAQHRIQRPSNPVAVGDRPVVDGRRDGCPRLDNRGHRVAVLVQNPPANLSHVPQSRHATDKSGVQAGGLSTADAGGYTAWLADRDPLAGKLRDGVYVTTGVQGQGFMRSPAIGQRLAGELLGGEGIPAFDPNRFDGDESFEVREGMAVEG